MFPLLKDSSSSITLVLPCTFFLQINFTASPSTPIEYIPWQWSDQDILRKNRLFPKVTQTWGSYTMSINSHMPNNMCPVLRVCGLVVRGASSLTVAQDVVRISTSGVYICVRMSLGKENGLLTFIFIFSKAIVTPTCGPRKKPNHAKFFSSTPTRYQKTQACSYCLCLFAIFSLGLVMLSSRKIMSITALG